MFGLLLLKTWENSSPIAKQQAAKLCGFDIADMQMLINRLPNINN
jgi:hypothetical protein